LDECFLEPSARTQP